MSSLSISFTRRLHEAINRFFESVTDFQSKKTTHKSPIFDTDNFIIMEGYLQESMSHAKWKSSSETVDESNNVVSDNFDCNICLDTVQDPVVTRCGHLYCWPCVYKWMNLSNKVNTLCPVCKTEISEKTLISLYVPTSTVKPNSQEKIVSIPRRPCRVHTMPRQQHSLRDIRQEVPNVILRASPISGMFGEMVCKGLFGNSEDLLSGYGDSYILAGMSTQRARRQAIRDERSLGRICFFLFCCVMLCLVLF
ncbi:E3 ubiquitin-protein ligase RMA1H1 [Lactuca sativa]|uniref:E3 ubiquitin-protein ligase RMA1H1 n=1 Tax=Lactuca sativa TaxID=4236 RepID=UPI001C6930F8|nr:E3 ubiquitin-protein ligase RMA1H1 [Lactuca sativa]